MDAATPILEFDRVAMTGGILYDAGLAEMTFRLDPGMWMAVRLEPGRAHIPLADLACGTADPGSGEVRFLGRAWTSAAPAEADRLRGRIGRVFEMENWISNLDVDENITLAQRYHTGRPEPEIRSGAEALARTFGFDALPGLRPSLLGTSDLMRLAWVRALHGAPDLILLERPARECAPAWRDRLIEEVAAACQRGAAAVWLTDDESTWQRLRAKAVLHFTHEDSMLNPVSGS